MKKLFLRLGLFSLIGFTLFMMVSFGHYRLLQRLFRPEHLRVDSGVSVLVIGDSHPECGLNPDAMKGVVNVSLSAEHYLLTYSKMKVLLDANPRIHTVILGYSFHNLNQFYDDFLKKDDHGQEWLDAYFPLLDAEGRDMVRAAPGFLISRLKYHYGFPLRMDFPILYKLLRGTLRVSDFYFWGQFREGIKNLLEDKYLKRTIDIHFYQEGRVQGLSPLQIYYLFRMAEDCERRRVNLVLLMTPLHKTYRTNIPPGFLGFYRGLGETLIRRYPRAQFWDFSELPLPDNFFRDSDHMSKDGAAYFSRMIMRCLENSW